MDALVDSQRQRPVFLSLQSSVVVVVAAVVVRGVREACQHFGVFTQTHNKRQTHRHTYTQKPTGDTLCGVSA